VINKIRLFNTVDYSIVDYESASDIIINQAKEHKSYSVFAMPVHGLVTAIKEKNMFTAAQKANMIVPDGQPIRWAMNYFHKTELKDRVYGPKLTLYVLEKAQKHKLKVFLYGGNTQETLNNFKSFIERRFPEVHICGCYREENPSDDTLTNDQVNNSGAHIVLVGRGCPRQEIWVANRLGKINAVMMAVGAAFSFHAGTSKQAPVWMQNNGLEWLFRLGTEPTRLWRRYIFTNSYFIYLFVKETMFKFFKHK